MHVDQARIRREFMRWTILLALNAARPEDLHDTVVVQTVQAIYPDATALEVRREIDYLVDRGLVSVRKQPTSIWWCGLSRYGVDIVEYTVDCEPGIARPVHYQAPR